MSTEGIPPVELGLTAGSPLLVSIKQCVVELARNMSVLPTVQKAAQDVLKTGWGVLLPTVSERTSALSQLLPSGEGTDNASLITYVHACLIFCKKLRMGV